MSDLLSVFIRYIEVNSAIHEMVSVDDFITQEAVEAEDTA